MSELQKSPNWDNRKNVTGFVRDGYPFNEGWPQCGPSDDKLFTVITRDGTRHTAYVDFTTQYRAEGLQWRKLNRESICKEVVVAWQEKKE